jgi:hypothetical protein
MVKRVFKFYFIIIGAVFCLIIVWPVLRFIDLTSSNSLIISKIIILLGYLYLGFKISYLLIQFYYQKVLVLRSSFNWSISILNWIAGGLIILVHSDSLFGSLNANIIMGVGCILAGFIHLPRFIKLDNDSITIYETKNIKIKYQDLQNIDYKGNLLAFETKLLNYKFKIATVDLKKITRIHDIIKSSNNN